MPKQGHITQNRNWIGEKYDYSADFTRVELQKLGDGPTNRLLHKLGCGWFTSLPSNKLLSLPNRGYFRVSDNLLEGITNSYSLLGTNCPMVPQLAPITPLTLNPQCHCISGLLGYMGSSSPKDVKQWIIWTHQPIRLLNSTTNTTSISIKNIVIM